MLEIYLLFHHLLSQSFIPPPLIPVFYSTTSYPSLLFHHLLSQSFIPPPLIPVFYSTTSYPSLLFHHLLSQSFIPPPLIPVFYSTTSYPSLLFHHLLSQSFIPPPLIPVFYSTTSYPSRCITPPLIPVVVLHHLFYFGMTTTITAETKVLETELQQLENAFSLSQETKERFIAEFVSEMQAGLETERCSKSLRMLPSYVTQRPTGNEQGTCMSFDLGGTNLRICLFELLGARTYRIVRQAKYIIPESAKTATLFEWIASCIEEFSLLGGSADSLFGVPCGFSFSFPFAQTALNEGRLLSWTKGFNMPGVVGQDVVALTQQALNNRNLNVRITAMVNDTVSMAVSCGYLCPGGQIGAIVGTGNNGCYWEETRNITKLQPSSTCSPSSPTEMVINIEWGAFDYTRSILPFTSYDAQLHAASISPGMQVLEKMISGMYLGELVRYILLYLVDRNLLFSGSVPPNLAVRDSIDTKHISSIIADSSPNKLAVRAVLLELYNVQNPTACDLDAVARVCNLVCTRAKILCALSISAVLLKRPTILSAPLAVGVDGSLYGKMHGFQDTVRDVVDSFLAPNNHNISLHFIPDGSVLGTAIIALKQSIAP
ncbi:hypothetical protein BB561_006290 [Smittium simulii]|uniref:Phosphotransferase n=1 Tax=Smittium simulii TaxID=133385 RepID=A0A2T9Y5C7_9FUNG|nr:hypothetical protein BB561_006290 [Smittium simulii]